MQAVLDAYPDWQIPAHVIATIVPTADRQKATVKVRIAFDGLDPRILPDMGVKVSFFRPRGHGQGHERGQGAREGDRARRRCVSRSGSWSTTRRRRSEVRTGKVRDGEVTVVSGLKGGDVVVVDPPKRLRDGATVKLKGA